MFDNIFELLHTAGGYIGAGGGLVAGEMLRRFNDARKKAKEAHDIAKEVAEELKALPTKEWVVQTIRREIERVTRGSLSGENAGVLAFRVQELERRTTGLENQYDDGQKESREWAEDIRTILGRLEAIVEQQKRRSD